MHEAAQWPGEYYTWNYYTLRKQTTVTHRISPTGSFSIWIQVLKFKLQPRTNTSNISGTTQQMIYMYLYMYT